MAQKMLDANIQKQLREIFAQLTDPVAIVFFSGKEENCDYCEETGQLLTELADISDKIQLHTFDIEEDVDTADQYAIDRVPTIMIAGLDGDQFVDYRFRFMGIPAGHEFSSLIRDILMVSSKDSGLEADTREYLAGLEKPVHLQVFVTPT